MLSSSTSPSRFPLQLPRSIRRVVLCCAAALSVFMGPLAVAQSDNELRQENAQLRARVAELQRELDAATQRLADLEAQIQAMRSGSNAQRNPVDGTQPAMEEKVSVDESKMDASPRALDKAVIKSYEDAVAGLPIGNAVTSRERQRYLSTVQRWTQRGNREFRINVTWNIEIIEVGNKTDKGFAMWVVAVDPVYGTQLGERFPAFLPDNRKSVVETHGLDATYAVRGLILPQLTVNPARVEQGPFNTPILVGPFAEWAFGLDIQTAVLAEPAKPAEDPDADPASIKVDDDSVDDDSID
ncbi:MAG: FtsB family cell division protein [Phycisphaerales bacterium]